MKILTIKVKMNYVNNNRIKAENQWHIFVKKPYYTEYSKIGGIYGPNRPKINEEIFKNIIIKKGQYFSRIHVLDISRLIVKIIFNSNKNNLLEFSR